MGDVLRGLAEPDAPRVAVTVLPLGSANNIAREFGLDRDPAELIAGWADATRFPYRLGELTTAAHRLPFIEAIGGGLIAAGIERAKQVEQEDADKVALGVRVLRELVDTLRSQQWHIELDGRDCGGTYVGVEVMLIGETGPKIPLAPAAEPEDRHLDVVLITDDDRDELAAYLDDRIAGSDPVPPALRVHRCLQAVLEPLEGSPFRVDDELWPEHLVGTAKARTRITLEVLRPT